MTAETWIFACAAAFFAGLVDAIAGGGGLITVPALLSAGLPPHVVLATNKAQAVFGAVASLLAYRKAGEVDDARARLGFPAGFAGSLLGVALVLHVPSEPLKPILWGMLLAALCGLLWIKRRPKQVDVTRPRVGPAALTTFAFVMGFYDGFFGPGTGTFLILGFVLLAGDDPLSASGNAKVVNLASNLAAVGLFALLGEPLWALALPMAALNIVGAVIGARLAVRIGSKVVTSVATAVTIALLAKIGFDVLASQR